MHALQLMEHEFRDAEMALTLAEMRSDVDKLVTKLSVKEAKEAAEAGETVALVSGGDGAAQTTHASEMLMKVTEYVQQVLSWLVPHLLPRLPAPIGRV